MSWSMTQQPATASSSKTCWTLLHKCRDTPPGVSVAVLQYLRTPREGCPYGYIFCRTVFADTRGRVSLRVYHIFGGYPFGWVIFDVFPNFVIILLISYHMVIIPALPNIAAVFFVTKPFECSCKPGDLRCPRRDTPPGVSVVYRN